MHPKVYLDIVEVETGNTNRTHHDDSFNPPYLVGQIEIFGLIP
jgi:hypothetical protein